VGQLAKTDLSCLQIFDLPSSLEGPPDSSAVEAVFDFDAGDYTTEDEISVDPDGMRIDRTTLTIVFDSGATVGEINTLLSFLDARIIPMLSEINILIVRIPDPGSLASLDSVIATLEANPLVLDVLKGTMAEPDELPPNYVNFVSEAELEPVDHQLAVRAHAAWNARAALGYSTSAAPVLVVSDYFGGGPPNDDFEVNVLVPADFSTVKSDDHGYHVLGVISGRYGPPADSSERGKVTGIYPGRLDLRVLDSTLGATTPLSLLRLSVLVRDLALLGRNIVVNRSLSDCRPSFPRWCIEKRARFWLLLLRGRSLYDTGTTGPESLENFFVLASAAGNILTAPSVNAKDAHLNTGVNAAALLDDLQTVGGVPLPNLINTLVVEAREHLLVHDYAPGCLWQGSKFPGNVSAIGKDVFSFFGASASDGTGWQSGTSFATPQVSGLAAYVWALKPSLTPQQVVDSIQKTARGTGLACTDPPKPVIDAYNAVLAVDDASALSGGYGAPVRLAILDVVGASPADLGGNEIFDEMDVGRILAELQVPSSNDPRYSRFDLNGDGYTGGSLTVPFNLDIDYPPTHTTVILCYYACSGLFQGDTFQRDAVLEPFLGECGYVEPAYEVWPQEPSLPFGTAGVPYRQEFTLRSLVPQMPVVEPVTWVLFSGSLPRGLKLENGALAGIPEAAGQFAFSVAGVDATGHGEESPNYSLVVHDPQSYGISHPPLVTYVDQEIDIQFSLMAGEQEVPASWALLESELPEEIVFSSDGRLAGTPTQSGRFSFTVMVGSPAGIILTESTTLKVYDLVLWRADQVSAGGTVRQWGGENVENSCATTRVSNRHPGLSCSPVSGCFYESSGCNESRVEAPMAPHFFSTFSAVEDGAATGFGGSASGSASSVTGIRLEDGFLIMEGQLDTDTSASRSDNYSSTGIANSNIFVRFKLRSETDYVFTWDCGLRYVSLWRIGTTNYIVRESWVPCTDEYGCTWNPCNRVLNCDGAKGKLEAGEYGLQIKADVGTAAQFGSCLPDSGGRARSGQFQLKLGPLPDL
jgi:subtilisin family serine protease